MGIFEEDENIDNRESNRIMQDNGLGKSLFDSNLGIQFSTDHNLFKKRHGQAEDRDQSMDPFTSHVKNLTPLSIIFNSVLQKSRIEYYNESEAFKLQYKTGGKS